MHRNRALMIGTFAACVISFGACGSGLSDEEAIKQSVASYFKGFASGDGALACGSMTEEFAQSFGEGLADGLPWLDTSSCESTVEGLAEFGAPTGVVTSVDIEGDTATAYLNKGTKVEMVKEDGKWLMNSGFTE